MSAGSERTPIEGAVAHLAARWRVAPIVHEVLVDHPHRAVFRTTGPGGRAVFVKVERGDRRARREVAALGLVAPAGIPVPDVVDVTLGDLSVLVLAAVPGRPLGADDPPAAWSAAARRLVTLHGVEVGLDVERFDHREADWLGFMRWWAAHEAALVTGRDMLDRRTATRLLRRIDTVLAAMPPPPRVLLHGDCQPDHVLLDERGAVRAIIDWGDASTGDPLWDLAVLTADHHDRLPTVRDAYGAEPSADEVVHAYWGVRHLGSATWLVDHGFDPTDDLQAARALAG